MQVSPGVIVSGTDCDVSSSASVARLASYAKSKLGRIDVWINNAGYSGSFQVNAAAACSCCCCTPAAVTPSKAWVFSVSTNAVMMYIKSQHCC